MPDQNTLIMYIVFGVIAVVAGFLVYRSLTKKKDKFLGFGEDYDEEETEDYDEEETEDYDEEDADDEEDAEDYDEEDAEDFEEEDDTYA